MVRQRRLGELFGCPVWVSLGFRSTLVIGADFLFLPMFVSPYDSRGTAQKVSAIVKGLNPERNGWPSAQDQRRA